MVAEPRPGEEYIDPRVYRVTLDGEELREVVFASEEAFYAVVYETDAQGKRLSRTLEGRYPGQIRIVHRTKTVYGEIRVEKLP